MRTGSPGTFHNHMPKENWKVSLQPRRPGMQLIYILGWGEVYAKMLSGKGGI